MAMTRTQALHVAASRNATRLAQSTGLPPNDLLDRQAAQGMPTVPSSSTSANPASPGVPNLQQLLEGL